MSKLAYSVADMLMIDETWTDPTCKDVVLNFGCFHHGVVQECRKSWSEEAGISRVGRINWAVTYVCDSIFCVHFFFSALETKQKRQKITR